MQVHKMKRFYRKMKRWLFPAIIAFDQAVPSAGAQIHPQPITRTIDHPPRSGPRAVPIARMAWARPSGQGALRRNGARCPNRACPYRTFRPNTKLAFIASD
jgi:hypothetical protein